MEVVAEAIQEVKAVETVVETTVEAPVQEAEKAVAAVEAKAEAIVAEVKKFATEARIAISAEESLLLTKLENEFLKNSMELRRIQDLLKNIQETYPKKVKELETKYLIDPAKYIFDLVQGAFVKKPN